MEAWSLVSKALRFQSALPRGERQLQLMNMLVENIFQSALPRGERPEPVHYFFGLG